MREGALGAEELPERPGAAAPQSDRAVASEQGIRERTLLLLALAFATFLVTGNGVSISPFLLDMAHDLQTNLAAIANLVALSSITWGIASVMAGSASDRLGRRPTLLVGLAILVLSPLGVALAQNYFWVAVWRIFGGIGGGAFMGTVYATVADRFPASERGRSLGWLTTGQSLSLVLGVPLITAIGDISGWRGAFAVYGLAMIVALALVWFAVPRGGVHGAAQTLPFRSVARLLGGRTTALLACALGERFCYASLAVFFPTYLITTYGVSLSRLALGLAIVASGNLVGSILGGRLTDHLPSALPLLAASLLLTGLLALPTMLWQGGLIISIGLGFLYTLLNSLGRPPLLTALSAISGEARGAVLGLNITVSSFGWLSVTAIGGPLVVTYGFGSLGLCIALFGLLSSALALGAWRIRRTIPATATPVSLD